MEIELDKLRILAIERYGADPNNFGAQRDGFVEGYKKAIEIIDQYELVCTACSGSGRYCGDNCSSCYGTGKETD